MSGLNGPNLNTAALLDVRMESGGLVLETEKVYLYLVGLLIRPFLPSSRSRTKILIVSSGHDIIESLSLSPEIMVVSKSGMLSNSITPVVLRNSQRSIWV